MILLRRISAARMETRTGVSDMAIYSLHHAAIGRSTHAPKTAAAHCRYITRRTACTTLLANLPSGTATDPASLAAWLNACENSDRKNARVIDKVTIAIPLELSPSDRAEVVSNFCKALTRNAVPWLAAIHDKGADATNPHAHIIIRDRSLADGKRVLHTSTAGSTEWMRSVWETVANDALSAAKVAARIDRRSYRERGVDQAPTIHLGAAERLEKRGVKTYKGSINRSIMKANKALDEAKRIVFEAEARLENDRTQERELHLEEDVSNDPTPFAPTSNFIGPGRLPPGAQKTRKHSRREDAEAELLKYWRVRKRADGDYYTNRIGAFVDRGDNIYSGTGHDLEIRAMLQLARCKGWSSVEISGNADFLRRASAAAIEAGFTVSATREVNVCAPVTAPPEARDELMERLMDAIMKRKTGRQRSR